MKEKLTKTIIFIAVFLLFPVAGLHARTYGPFRVDKIENGFIYFSGEDVYKLSTTRTYKIFKIMVKGYPTSITEITPVGKTKIFSVADDSGIMYYPNGVSREILKVNTRFFLVRGKFIELERKKKRLEEKAELTSIIAGHFYFTTYNADLSVVGFSTSYKLLNLYASISLEFRVGYYNLNYEEEVDVLQPDGSYENGLEPRSLSALYLTLCGGFDTGKEALMLGPVLGVVDSYNATGFDMYFRFGDIMGSNFKIEFVTLPKGELVELDLSARILVNDKSGLGVGFYYRLGSHPDINDLNHALMAGVSKLTPNSFFGLMFGMGLAGDTYRGPTLSLNGGLKF